MFSNLQVTIPHAHDSYIYNGYFRGQLLFIVERPYMDLELVYGEDCEQLFIPRTKTSYEFYVEEPVSGSEGRIAHIVLKEQLVKGDDFYATRCFFNIGAVDKDKLMIERARASYEAKDVEIRIDIHDKTSEDDLYGYDVFLNGSQVGFFSEFGSEEIFSPQSTSTIYFDFDAVANLTKKPKTLISTRDFTLEKEKDTFVKAIKAIAPDYIFNLFPMTDYTVIGVTDDEDRILIKSNSPDKSSTNKDYVYYEYDVDDFWVTKVTVKENKNGYYQTYSSEYLPPIRQFNKSHLSCGMEFEFSKGFTVNEDEEICELYEILILGGEVTRTRNIKERQK